MTEKTIDLVARLTNIPSPTGDTETIIRLISAELAEYGYQANMTNKGGLMVTVPGKNDVAQRFITAHVDTLGAMVRAIKPDGRLKLDLIGGFRFNAIEGEYCQISTQTGQTFSGTILMHQTSVHVYQDAGTAERNQKNMEIRLDEKVTSAEETAALGIQVGDFISFEPRTEITTSGFIKSRHLDDKVSVAILIQFLKQLATTKQELPHTTHFFFSNNEEIGYGGNSNIPEKVVEYMAIDMGAMGDDQQTDEYTVSICVKDASGPYHLGLRNTLVALCQTNSIPYQLDIYPFYGSDASAAMKAGADVRHGLIGAGIDASHAYERTHNDSIEATEQLVTSYLHNSMLLEK
ncbi:M42 family metallopeptidase [Vagococcus intermedius]|uniref:M42 family metallopeptidase n=1 Tax=Vagococcus intermedius TaxID=2991418 RepID=A0AAF0I980_9ENTE|nr:M42 family metallopeptidase [Vagococcus intermedius]WEG73202.1 M42 family metallopeptidase [Vagococcus intermedius]WEG75287.1 M42 family metallopeptidase [Vagococcus intermedius]